MERNFAKGRKWHKRYSNKKVLRRSIRQLIITGPIQINEKESQLKRGKEASKSNVQVEHTLKSRGRRSSEEPIVKKPTEVVERGVVEIWSRTRINHRTWGHRTSETPIISRSVTRPFPLWQERRSKYFLRNETVGCTQVENRRMWRTPKSRP